MKCSVKLSAEGAVVVWDCELLVDLVGFSHASDVMFPGCGVIEVHGG